MRRWYWWSLSRWVLRSNIALSWAVTRLELFPMMPLAAYGTLLKRNKKGRLPLVFYLLRSCWGGLSETKSIHGVAVVVKRAAIQQIGRAHV